MSESTARRPAASAARAAAGRAVCARLAANPRARRMPLETAEVYIVPSFVTPAECAELCARIDEGAMPSITFRPVADFRTSETCHLDPSPVVRAIDLRLSELLGIPPRHGEPMQGQRYLAGQYYRPHYDWFFEGDDLWPEIRKAGGHRTFTAMAYLSDVEGGATFFPRLGMRVSPKRGALLVWNNLDAGGASNDFTLHEAEPVLRGTKYVFTKWYREAERPAPPPR